MVAPALESGVAGARQLLQATIRHDGRNFAPFILGPTVLSVTAVLLYPLLFPELADRMGLATAVGSNPAIGLIFGPAFDLLTDDGFNAWRSLALGGFLVALGSIFAVIRATRGQEDSGQAELLASGVLGRGSRLLAGVGVALLGSLLTGVISSLLTVLFGGGWNDSLLLGATFTASGWMFAGIAAIAAQLGSDARSANSIAIGTLGALFVLRGFAYAITAPGWAIWINPLGWLTETKPAVTNLWWPLLLAFGFTVVTLVVAFVLQARRDFGQGAIAPKPGPARGAIHTTWGLAVRLNRGTLITWTITFAMLGVVFGYFVTSVRDILGNDSAVAHVLAAGATTPEQLISTFMVTVLSLLGIVAAIPGVQTILKVRREEMEDRVEPIMAGAIDRRRYYASNIILAFLAPAVFLTIAGLLVATLASQADIGLTFSHVIRQALVTIPAVWTVIAVAVAVIGARPKVMLAAWLGVIASFFLTLLGPTFRLWDSVLAISPFWHVPNVTDPTWSGLGWITLATLLFLALGIIGFRRRDLAVS